MNWKAMKRAALLLPLLMVLAACGGGDDGSADTGGTGGTGDDNADPTVSAGNDQDVLARKAVTLQASADDSDGSVSSVTWTQTKGTEVTLASGNDGSAEFTAPDVDEQETLTFSVTATDDDGATATDTVDVLVTPSVTLSAKAYDGPLKGATVTVTVGDKTYTATTNDDGVFVLDIGSPDSAAMITITATGGTGQENAELVSIAGTFGALAAAAGDDGTLESSESGTVNVTNLSTAKAVLMIDANGGELPADDDALTELEKNLDVDAVVELATVIKLVIDEDVALPEDVESTYDLVSDSSAVDSVVAAAEAEQPGVFESTMNEMLADKELLPGFSADDFPGIYFVNRVGDYVFGNRGFTVDLKAGGAGFIYGSGPAESAAMTWVLNDDGTLVVTIDESDPFRSRGTCGAGITCEVTTTGLVFRQVTDGAAVDSVSMSRTGTIEYPFNPDMAPEALSGSSLYLAMEPGALEPFTAADVTGTWSVPLSYPNPDPAGDRYETDLLSFNADGSGLRPADGVNFTWTIDEDGVLSIAFSDGDALDLYALRTEGELALDVMAIMLTASGDTYTLAHLLVTGVDSEYPGSLVGADFDGEWHYTDWLGFNYVIDSSAGSATATYYAPDGTVNAAFPAGFSYSAGKMHVISWIDVTGPPPNPSISNCAAASGDCFYSYSSTWTPLVEDSSGRIFMLEKDRGWNYDGGNTVDFRGDLTYRHGTNRWLLPAGTGADGMGKTKAGTSARLGDRVRALMADQIMANHLR